ncbi:hypothetical protein KEM55_005231 [Ascosphaera atra]|nr:hypothetical protein KEM55_005231 [Ascosphaera atra]
MSVVPKNIVAMIEGKEPTEKFTPPPQGIHLSLGKTSNVVFGNPVDGNSKPYVDMKNDGVEDFSIDNFWTRMGFKVRSPSEYHL